jgi:hypothetical protein
MRFFIFYGFHCIDLVVLVRYRTRVHADTEVRIQQLCTEAIAAKTQVDVDRIIPELRAALEEHIQLAREFLGPQAIKIAHLNGMGSKDPSNG